MLRKLTFMLSAAACGAMVASCGGSNTPVTPPTDDPTSAPTPTPTGTPTLLDLTQDFTASSGVVYLYANFTPTGGVEVFSDASRLTGTGAISFALSPERVLYGFPGLDPVAEFAGTDLVSASATMRTYANGDESLIMELPFTHAMRVSYERVDPFLSGTVPGDLRSRRVTMFGNSITTTDDIAGPLTYTGVPEVVGGETNVTLSDAVSTQATTFTITPGDGTTTANPSTIAGTIDVFEDVGGVATQTASLPFAGNVATGGTFVGAIDDTTFEFTGAYGGSMVGPDREELVLVFSVSHTDGRKYVGSLIAD